MCALKALLSDTYSHFGLGLTHKSHLDATCFDKQIRLRMRRVRAKSHRSQLVLQYSNANRCYTAIYLKEQKQQKPTKGLPVHFQAI